MERAGPFDRADAEALKAHYAYDDRGLLATQMVQRNGGPQWTTTWTRPTASVLGGVSVERDGLGPTEMKGRAVYGYYDNAWLHWKTIDPPMDTVEERVEYTYDALGRAASMTRVLPGTGSFPLEAYAYDDGGNLTSFQRGHDGTDPLEDWVYDPADGFGEIVERADTMSASLDGHGLLRGPRKRPSDGRVGRQQSARPKARPRRPGTGRRNGYDALHRLTRWFTKDGSTITADRQYSYDGASRLATIVEAVSGNETELWYDVDDGLVREERDGVVFRRFLGHRAGPDANSPSPEAIEVMEPVIANVNRIVRDGSAEYRLSLVDVDGHAALGWLLDGTHEGELIETEITGIYGAEVLGAPGDWSVGELLEVEGLHGSEVDRLNDVVHFGARHMLHRDGMWMQPEPLLMTAKIMGFVANPMAGSRQYSAGNPLLLADYFGRYPGPFTEAAMQDPGVTKVTFSDAQQAEMRGFTSAGAAQERIRYQRVDRQVGVPRWRAPGHHDFARPPVRQSDQGKPSSALCRQRYGHHPYALCKDRLPQRCQRGGR